MPGPDGPQPPLPARDGSVKKDGGRLRARSGTFLEPGTAEPPAGPVASPPAPPAPAPQSLDAGAATEPPAGSAPPGTWRSESKSAARLLLCKLAAAAACDASRRGAAFPARLAGVSAAPGEGGPGVAAPMRPLHRLICFCRYLRWFTFRFDLPGLSSASLMLLDAESMKLSRSRVASRTSPPSVPASSAAAGVPVSSSSKQQPLSRAPKAPPSPSGEPPKPKGTNGCVLRSAACTAIAAALPRPAAQLVSLAPALAPCVRRSLLAPGRDRSSASRGSSLGLVIRRHGFHSQLWQQ
uniref:Uncharacterized protein n=1 Tax=Rhinolophus ferrumequinum TaxID=59479 RepID=A0A671G297_RHIFE